MMNRTSYCGRLALVGLVCLWGASCAHGRGKASENKVGETVSDGVMDAPSALNYELKLRRAIRKEIASASSGIGDDRSRLIRRKPYYYKEYSVYPDGPDAFGLAMQEQEALTTPYSADVVLRKLRYATRFRREKDRARADSDFLRDSGTETITYELRNGKWKRVGSLFVSDRTEELVSGEWSRVQPPPKAKATETSGDGWLNRAWNSIRFWR